LLQKPGLISHFYSAALAGRILICQLMAMRSANGILASDSFSLAGLQIISGLLEITQNTGAIALPFEPHNRTVERFAISNRNSYHDRPLW
jgi:hypothetical protein